MYLHFLCPPPNWVLLSWHCKKKRCLKKFNFLKLIAVLFVTQDVSYLEECSIALEKKMYSVTFGRNVLKYQLSLFDVGMLMCAQYYKTVWDPRVCQFSRQEYCSGLPFPSPEDLPKPGFEHWFPALGSKFFITWATWRTMSCKTCVFTFILFLDDIFIGVSDVLKSPLLLCYCQFSLL